MMMLRARSSQVSRAGRLHRSLAENHAVPSECQDALHHASQELTLRLVLHAALGGTGIIVFSTLFNTTMQQQVPERHLSKVSSYDWFASLTAYPIGLAIAGPVAAAAGVRPVLWETGLAAVLALLLIASIRHLTSDIPEHARPEAPPPASA